MDIAQSVWNEVDASNNTPAPDGAPEGMFPSGINDVLRAHQGAIKRWYDQTIPLLTGGSATAYALAYGVAPTALADGMVHVVQFNATNGAAATLNVNSLGAKPLYTYQPSGWAAAPAGVLTANMISRVAYNAASGAYRVLEVAGTGTWTPTDASGAGLTFSNVTANYQVLGNMVFAYFYLTFPATGNGSNVSIGGLPVAVPNANNVAIPGLVDSQGATFNGIFIRPVKNTSTFTLIAGTGTAVVINSQISNSTFSGCVTYPVG